MLSTPIRVAALVALFTMSAIALAVVVPAFAEHVPGATYDGTHNGGGGVDFDVSQDGSGITRFRATDIPGDTCDFPEVEVNFTTPVAIQNHMFSRTVANGLSFDGAFDTPGGAQGTLKMHQNAIPPFVPACDSGDIPWTAATEAGPNPTPTPSPTVTPSPSPTTSPSPTATEDPGLDLGDINCDGDINLADFELLIEYAAGLIGGQQQAPCPDVGEPFEDLAWGDVNCDGVVDILDALYVLAHIAGAPLPTPGGCTHLNEPLV